MTEKYNYSTYLVNYKVHSGGLRTRRLLITALLALCASLFASNASAQTVLKRERLGNNAADIEFIRSGRYAKRIAILDGYDVIGIKSKDHDHGQDNDNDDQGNNDDDREVKKLFDVKRLPIFIRPEGIAYVDSERLFVFNDVLQPDQLIFSDEHGNPAGRRTLVLPAGLNLIHVEALAYIQPGSPFFPDHIMELVFDENFVGHVLIIQRDGQVVSDIVPDQGPEGICGMSFAGPDRILIGTCTNSFFAADLAGHAVSAPVILDSESSCEGLAQLSNGRIAASPYDSGKVFFYDSDLDRLPEDDQSYKIGIGLTRAAFPTWNPDTKELMFMYRNAVGLPTIEGVSESLQSKRQIMDLAAPNISTPAFDPFSVGSISYLPDEQRIAVSSSRNPRGIFLFNNNSVFQEFINFTPPGSPVRSPVGIYYLSGIQQFAVGLRGAANHNLIHIVSRTGAPIRALDLNPFGIIEANIAYFEPTHSTGGKLLVMDSANDALILDLNGTLLRRFPYRQALDLPFGVAGGVTAITTGKYAGAFAAVNVNNSEVVIFKLD